MIQLTRATEYAFRGIQYLASQPAGTVCMLSTISQDQDVPLSFLGKIFQMLVRANILTSHRGAGGGFSLSRPADDITLLAIIEAVEGPIVMYECLLDETFCSEARRADCCIRPVLQDAITALQDVFSRTNAADLVPKPAESAASSVQSIVN